MFSEAENKRRIAVEKQQLERHNQLIGQLKLVLQLS